MVLAATLLAFAYIFGSSAVPAVAYFFKNLGTGLWMTDYNFTSSTKFGNPIVGAPFDDSNTAIQSWQLVFYPHSGDRYALVTQRKEGTTAISAYAAADAVELGRLKTADPGRGIPVQIKHPDETNTDVFAFVIPLNPPLPSLAITASSGEYQPLFLTKYDPSKTTQLWESYTHLNAAVAGRPISLQDLRPATRAEMLAEAKEN